MNWLTQPITMPMWEFILCCVTAILGYQLASWVQNR